MASTTTIVVTSSSSSTETITTLAMTTIFTPPADCSSSWTYEPYSQNQVSNGLLMQNCVAADPTCFPSGYSHAGRQLITAHVYSPGWCPMGYTSADMVIAQSTTTAFCCLSNFDWVSFTTPQEWGLATFAGCYSMFPSTSSTIVTVRQSDISTQVTGPITMWAQPIKIELQSSDSSLFVTASATSSTSTTPTTTVAEPASTTSVASSTVPATSTSSSATNNSSSGLTSGAEVGIGVGVGVGALSLIIGIVFLILRHYKMRRKQAPIVDAQYPYYYGGELVNTGKFRQMAPAELATSPGGGNHTNIHELVA
ncbi:hypothetical protein BDQ94DRAFT_147840 [Aspergillus welwitschiae]|uniref:Mid2 domain-containing protein n=2 Tax=Aspergillus TaxID=5052 RepID=A0A3F3PVL8_9EURO|nr:hypothetical protein BDQ94DRAFT_147840 [Aspergillus welwitschiae]RDH30980.1 hypothetical protein BDQ94DRAFT_147840 [Aspergillus welwitschiae]